MKYSDKKDLEHTITVKAWRDPEFRVRLLEDSKAAMKELGVKNIPQGVTIKVLEDTAEIVHLVLPRHPVGGQVLSNDECSASLLSGKTESDPCCPLTLPSAVKGCC